jgi:hypothetical protein
MVITPSRIGALSMAPPSASLPNPHRLRQATLESTLTTFIMKSALIVNPLLPYCRVDAEVALRRFEFHREEPIRSERSTTFQDSSTRALVQIYS